MAALRRSLALLFLSLAPAGVTAGFATDFAVLRAQAKGVITNAYGPIKAKVSANASALTVQFNIVAGTGYAAGSVTATTNAKGQVIKLVKGTQTCNIFYTTANAIRTVSCLTTRRHLGSPQDTEGEIQIEEGTDVDVAAEVEGTETGADGDHFGSRRRLAACSPCDTLVIAAFTTWIKKLCGNAFSTKVPIQYSWAKRAAAALCSMTTKLEKPRVLAKKTCRCCKANMDCASGVCSAGVCLPHAIKNGKACPDLEDADCASGACARKSFPGGEYVCCASGDYIQSPTTLDLYCKFSQGSGTQCESNQMCFSGVCSEGICLSQGIGDGLACPDLEDNDCASGACARKSFPDGDFVCCASGDYIQSPTTLDLYCKFSQGSGTQCESNQMCFSGVCSESICLSQGIGDGLACPDLEDNDCARGACARSSYPSGGYVCCASGDYIQSPTTLDLYCKFNLGAGSQCESNQMCFSGVCSEGLCLSQGIGDGLACPDLEDIDCASGACARSSYPAGGYICCASGDYIQSPTTLDLYCKFNLGAGSQCESNEMCFSGVCSAGVCLA